MAKQKTGVWIIGARGGVGVTAITGLCALQRQLISDTGLVSQLPLFAGLDLLPWEQFVVGGHDIRDNPVSAEAERLHRDSRVLNESLLVECRADFAAVEERIRPGTVRNVGATIQQLASSAGHDEDASPQEIITQIRADLVAFRQAEELARVVVVNLASTEPPIDLGSIPDDWAQLEQTLGDRDANPLPASSLYAIAAFAEGMPYINFTPSLGATLPALDALATAQDTCHAGRDGKTGETLLKTVLAPMFASRNLEVLSWVGHNIFGNLDGLVLDNPVNKQSKVTSKDRVLGAMLGYDPQTLVTIEYIRSLGDWKTAWDHIHFRGFLDTPMTMQLTWQGCDSLLAAPLVLDLVRFTELAHRRGERGTLSFLSSFFKSPIGCDEHDFGKQFAQLVAWSQAASAADR